MRQLLLALAFLAFALPAEAGRRRGNPEPVVIYFPVLFDYDGQELRPGATYSVQIPLKDGWTTVATVGQGECLRYDRQLSGRNPPYWVRACWSDDETICSEAGIDCDPSDPQWGWRVLAPEDVCTVRACGYETPIVDTSPAGNDVTVDEIPVNDVTVDEVPLNDAIVEP